MYLRVKLRPDYLVMVRTGRHNVLKYLQDINLPGGHSMHPFFPSEEELVKVPRGHGWKYAADLLLAFLLNPEAKRTPTKVFDGAIKSGDIISIASSSELRGFLEETNQFCLKTRNYIHSLLCLLQINFRIFFKLQWILNETMQNWFVIHFANLFT